MTRAPHSSFRLGSSLFRSITYEKPPSRSVPHPNAYGIACSTAGEKNELCRPDHGLRHRRHYRCYFRTVCDSPFMVKQCSFAQKPQPGQVLRHRQRKRADSKESARLLFPKIFFGEGTTKGNDLRKRTAQNDMQVQRNSCRLTIQSAWLEAILANCSQNIVVHLRAKRADDLQV